MIYRDAQALVALESAGHGKGRLSSLGDDGRDRLAALCDGMSLNGDKRMAVNEILKDCKVIQPRDLAPGEMLESAELPEGSSATEVKSISAPVFSDEE